ncbi:hypothetical protein SY27_07130 [Flavobacterium sp. 316]|uniref:hypothetical protein n=1 Tax=Flavobacterium sp. 316 TaxID=1603293 RepID=UPI0005E5AAB3|nr:hypothetical protein [Flavobacterium sp. 316]KIX21474.1 hypothetical protein SY27_07130 [Flavobacterium sp. 316]
MKLKYYLFIFFAIFINCKNQEGKLTNREKSILNKCIKDVIKNDSSLENSSYIVNPYFGSFAFNNYIANNYEIDEKTYKNKNNVLKKIDLTNEKFESLQKKINKEFLNKKNIELEGLSKGRKSKKILTFSGVGEKLVFLEVITYLDEIDLDKLKNNSIQINNNKIKDITSLTFILNGNDITEVTIDGGIVFER